MVIENTFLELLQERPVSRITVTEICRRSHINRTTFYHHYRDPLDLMEKLEEELLESLRSLIFQKSYTDITAVFCGVLSALKENSGRYKALVSAHGDTGLPGRIFALCYDMIFPLICDRYPHLDSVQQNLLYRYITQGFSGTVSYWLENGMEEPAEKIAEFAGRATCAVTRDFA
ncbi:MAG: TetR/AcrR family transcriptional regulator [bacterium]|nr:TetR/AcrR family transcriptional regulator [bacterium]MCM1375792.1 TetR/AcrR family transcriptional regulator [Muribaculum sp.]